MQYYLDMGLQYSAPATQNYLQMTGAVKSFAAPDNVNYMLMNGEKDKNAANGKRFSSVVDPVYSNGNRQSAKNEYVNPPMGKDLNGANHSEDNYIPATTTGDLDVVVTTIASQQNDAANEDFSAGYKAMF